MAHLHIVNTKRLQHDDFVSTFDTTTFQPEAGSACSQFLEDQQPPKAQTVTPWQRIKRAVRGWWVSRTYRP